MPDKEGIPQGLNWIKAILILGIIGGIFALILKKTIFSSVGFIGGIFGDILIIATIVIMLLIIIGIYKRAYGLYKLALIWFGIEILLSLASLITGLVKLEAISQATSPIFRMALNSLFIWYLSKRKDYFTDKRKPFNFEDSTIQKQEKVFKRILIAIFIIYLVFAIVGPKALEMYQMVTIMKGVADKEVPVALDLCRAKSSGDKDYCIYKLIDLKKDEYDFGEGEICEEISSVKYKDSCYLQLELCNKISDKNTKKACELLSKIPTGK